MLNSKVIELMPLYLSTCQLTYLNRASASSHIDENELVGIKIEDTDGNDCFLPFSSVIKSKIEDEHSLDDGFNVGDEIVVANFVTSYIHIRSRFGQFNYQLDPLTLKNDGSVKVSLVTHERNAIKPAKMIFAVFNGLQFVLHLVDQIETFSANTISTI